jgi:hypothetical protein
MNELYWSLKPLASSLNHPMYLYLLGFNLFSTCSFWESKGNATFVACFSAIPSVIQKQVLVLPFLQIETFQLISFHK